MISVISQVERRRAEVEITDYCVIKDYYYYYYY